MRTSERARGQAVAVPQMAIVFLARDGLPPQDGVCRARDSNKSSCLANLRGLSSRHEDANVRERQARMRES